VSEPLYHHQTQAFASPTVSTVQGGPIEDPHDAKSGSFPGSLGPSSS
jgi:hypothetical protein